MDIGMRFSAVGLFDYKDEGMLSHLDKNGKFLFNNFFWNFHISVKKSADFSCLFTFFQKNCKIILIFPTFWELHNCKFKLAICLHFWNQLIYVVILKCKQFINFCSQLCNSQNVGKIKMILQFFWKNVNKQLKSADFFSEMWKFQKNLLNKNFPFFIQMWQHTFIFVVNNPMAENLMPISMFCY